MFLFPEVKSPLSFHIVPWAWTTMKAYLESVYMLIFFPWDNSKALVRAISLTFCAKVPMARVWTPTTLPKVATAHH